MKPRTATIIATGSDAEDAFITAMDRFEALIGGPVEMMAEPESTHYTVQNGGVVCRLVMREVEGS